MILFTSDSSRSKRFLPQKDEGRRTSLDLPIERQNPRSAKISVVDFRSFCQAPRQIDPLTTQGIDPARHDAAGIDAARLMGGGAGRRAAA
jgi:hypothetical protein